MKILIRIEAPHYVAGLEFDTESDMKKIVRCAPIVKWMKRKRWGIEEVTEYLNNKKFKWQWMYTPSVR